MRSIYHKGTENTEKSLFSFFTLCPPCLRGEKKHTSSLYDLIHRSLLAGLPANIGLKGEEREFTAARNRRFFIFPGSALFKKPPEWVMVMGRL